GAGKTALLSLLPRLYPAPDGTVFVDGIDINRWPLHELRKQIGYVAQDVFLFSESVAENLAFGLGEWALGAEREERLSAATRIAAIDEEIRRMREGYGTRLGERG